MTVSLSFTMVTRDLLKQRRGCSESLGDLWRCIGLGKGEIWACLRRKSERIKYLEDDCNDLNTHGLYSFSR